MRASGAANRPAGTRAASGALGRFALSLLLGCSGEIRDRASYRAPASLGDAHGAGAAAATGDAGIGGAPGGGHSPAAGQVAPDGGAGQNAASCEPAPSPIRRLSHVEYRNTLRELFPTLQPPEIELAADETIGGFTNHHAALNPSDLLIEQYFAASRVLVEALEPTLDAYLSCDPAAGEVCAEQFVAELGARAFRRPLDAEEVARFAAIFAQPPADSDFRLGMQLVIQALLTSPDFLYRPELGVASGELTGSDALSDYELASRLSYFVWATMPDEALLVAAERGSLRTPAGLQAEVRRMLDDDKARQGILTFHREWLKLAQLDRVLKSEADGYDAQLRAEIAESLERFVWDTLIARGGSIQDLMTGSAFPASARVAQLLGTEAVPEGAWRTVTADPDERAGVLTHPAFLAAHAYADYPSPVLRGVFILDRMLCAPPSPPPPGVTMQVPTASSAGTPLTNREAYAEATREDRCQGCHASINPLGFAFEHYDTLGRYRTQDNGVAVDASGEVFDYRFANGVELAHQLAESERYQRCVVDKWAAFALGGAPLARDRCFRDDLFAAFVERGFDVAELIVAIATHPKFAQRAFGVEDEP